MTTPRIVWCGPGRGNCKHFRGIVGPTEDPVFVCTAFPKGIPEEILSGENEHRRPFPGDDGVRYEPEIA